MNDSQHEAKAMAKANGSKIMITIAFVSHSWMQLNFFLCGPSAQNRKNETKIFSAETLTANDYKSKCEFSIFQLNFETIALRTEPSKRKQLSERTSERMNKRTVYLRATPILHLITLICCYLFASVHGIFIELNRCICRTCSK